MILEILLSILLLIVVIQDFRYRAISKLLIPFLFGIAISISYRSQILMDVTTGSAINLGFLLLQYLVLTVYFSIRNKELTNIVNKYLGVGDIWFFLPICFLFSPANFILFMLFSLFIILTGFAIYRIIIRANVSTIPLAGGASATLILIIALKYLMNLNLYDNGVVYYLLKTLYV